MRSLAASVAGSFSLWCRQLGITSKTSLCSPLCLIQWRHVPQQTLSSSGKIPPVSLKHEVQTLSSSLSSLLFWVLPLAHSTQILRWGEGGKPTHADTSAQPAALHTVERRAGIHIHRLLSLIEQMMSGLQRRTGNPWARTYMIIWQLWLPVKAVPWSNALDH